MVITWLNVWLLEKSSWKCEVQYNLALNVFRYIVVSKCFQAARMLNKVINP